MRKLEKVYYTDLDDVTVYNWHKLNKTNDFQWICRPKQKPDIRAIGVYQSLLFQFESLNLSILQEKKDIILQVISLVLKISESKQMNPEILESVTILLQALMINPAAADINVLIKLLQEPDQKFQISLIANAKKKLERIIKSETNTDKDDIYEKTARMEKHFGINIDISKISIKQYQAYETVIINEYKAQRHGRG